MWKGIAVPGGGGGGTQQSFIRGGSARRSKPSPFYIPFLIEKVPLSYTFHGKWYPFHIPTEQLLLNFSPEKPLKILGWISRKARLFEIFWKSLLIPKWQFSQHFPILQLLKSLPFYIPPTLFLEVMSWRTTLPTPTPVITPLSRKPCLQLRSLGPCSSRPRSERRTGKGETLSVASLSFYYLMFRQTSIMADDAPQKTYPEDILKLNEDTSDEKIKQTFDQWADTYEQVSSTIELSL